MAFSMNFFKPHELTVDSTGDEYIKVNGMTRYLGCSPQMFYKTHVKKNGLRPMLRRINGYSVWAPEDLKKYSELRKPD